MRPLLQTFYTLSAVAKFRGLKLIAVVFCIGACSLTHAATIEFSGPLVLISYDDGGAIYSGAQIGTVFSGAIDDETFDGFIFDGATLTPFTEFGRGGMWAENNLIMDADEAILVNSLASTSFVAGDLYDEIEMGGAASTSSEGEGQIQISLVFILDPLAFDSNPVDYYPPNPDDTLLVLFLIEQLDDQEEGIFLALGAVGGPLEILVDIKPGSDPNCFNVNGHGVIPVAILGSDTFYVTDIDQGSLSFGGLEVRIRGNKGPLCRVDYSDGDEYLDLVCQFEDNSDFWNPGDGEATLTGTLMDGTEFEGTDSICVVP